MGKHKLSSLTQTAMWLCVLLVFVTGCEQGELIGGSSADMRLGWAFLMGTNDSTSATYNGSYGTKGVASPSNLPGAREQAPSCIDSGGNFWIFGGASYHPGGGAKKDSNDLWKFNGTSWTWVSGGSTGGEPAVYGTKGVADPNNVPGARQTALMWCDHSGNIWVFGGWGYDSGAAEGYLNDLWKFDGTNWTWVSGPSTIGQAPVYGVKGVADPANNPGGRWDARVTFDKNGVLWMFGGDSTAGSMNDLWKFDGTNWTWVSGTNLPNQSGVYGTKGVSNGANQPGGRDEPSVMVFDSSNNLWIYGGYGYDKNGTSADLGDLWKFDGTNWTWVSGYDIGAQTGVYGTKGVASAASAPGNREAGIGWIDQHDNIWLYSGWGFDEAGGAEKNLQDLWKYDGSNWTWVSGDKIGNQAAAYGTAGLTDLANHPAGFWYPLFAYDSVRHTVWTLGGWALRANGSYEDTNETWRFYTGGLK